MYVQYSNSRVFQRALNFVKQSFVFYYIRSLPFVHHIGVHAGES